MFHLKGVARWVAGSCVAVAASCGLGACHRSMHLIVVASLALVAGCASTGAAVLHTLHYCNVGPTTVTQVRIEYGEIVVPPTLDSRMNGGADPRCASGAVYGYSMPVPKAMRIHWVLEDGRRQTIVVPVRERLLPAYAPNRIQVRFEDDKVEVLEYAYPSKADERIKQIYP